jgi:outer membrane protein assembly factor BamB
MQSTAALLLAAVVFPPAGLVLLWRRPAAGWVKALGTLAILAVGVVELFKVYGLRVELDGAATRPFVSFQSPEVKAQALEQHRAAPPPPAPAPTPVVTLEPAVRNYWTDFRGPGRLSIYDEMPILTSWPEGGLRRLWKQPIGGGYASFVVAGGVAFTIEQRRDQEVVAAYDVATGREKWTNKWHARFSESMGGDGPRATPVFDDGRIYALGAEGELRVLEAATGRMVWSKNILSDNDATNLQWGMAASPLIVDGKVIVLPGGKSGKSVVAYDKLTGARVWSVLDDRQAYVSPVVATLGGQRQLLVVSARRVVGLGIEDGNLLWETPWVTQYDMSSTEPIVVGPSRFLISSSGDTGAMVVEIEAGQPRVIWRNKKMKTKFNGGVLYQGYVYGLDEGILACVNVETGEQAWKGGRYGYGQILLASGHLVVLSERGELALVKAAPGGYTEVAKFEAISGKTWNYPAIAGGVLLVRNAEEMAAFRLGRE